MRLALIVHARSPGGARFDGRLLRESMLLPDLGFTVIDMPASDEPALGLHRALEGAKAGSSVLVYISAEVTRGMMGVIELSGGTRNVRIEELRAALVTTNTAEALLVLDGVFAAPEDDPLAAAEVAATVVRVIAPHSSGVGTLVSLRRTSAEGEPGAPLLQLLLEHASGVAREDEGRATVAQIYERLADDPRQYERSSALVYSPSGRDFVLVRPAARSPFVTQPSLDQSFFEAERLIAAGQLDEALEACKRVLFLSSSDPVQRAEVFVRVAAIKQRQGKPRESVFNLDKALSIDPQHRTALEGLLLFAVEEARWDDVAQLGERLVAAIESVDEAFQVLSDLGRVFQDAAGDEARALIFFERAVRLRPLADEALERLIRLYDRARRFPEMVSALEAYAAATPLAFARAARLAAAAKVAYAALGDNARAVALYDHALRIRSDDDALCAEFAALLEESGDYDRALAVRQRVARFGPRRPDTYRALVRLAQRLGREDVAFNAAMVLSHLGEADLDEELLADQHRPDGPLRAARPLDPSAWEEHIAPPEERAVMRVLEAIDEAAVSARLAELAEAGRLVSLDPAERLDLGKSTLSAVRVFGFAGRLLGVPLPELYILAEVPGGVASALAERPTTVIGRRLLSGRSLPELSFIMARHLAYHRPGARVALYYRELPELTALVLGAVQLVRPEFAPSSPQGLALGKARSQLAARLGEGDRARLDRAVRDLEAQGGRIDLLSWVRRLDLTATRAGLLACGDLGVAARLIEDDPVEYGDLSPERRVDDLFAFCVSDAYETLRSSFGVALAPPSLLPPPPGRISGSMPPPGRISGSVPPPAGSGRPSASPASEGSGRPR